MAEIPGFSFSPLNNTQNRQNPGEQKAVGGDINPVQQAIRTLSYRNPKTVGASSPIPGALLNGAGSAGLAAPAMAQAMPGQGTMAAPSLGLEEILRRLFGLGPMAASSPMAQSSPMAASASAPMPRVGAGYGDGAGILPGEPTPGEFHPGGVVPDAPVAPAPQTPGSWRQDDEYKTASVY